MEDAGSISMTSSSFNHREKRRRLLFSHTWRNLVPKVFEDVPKYYRTGNIVASLGLWELWVWQFVKAIKLEPGYKALDVCADTNNIGIRLLQKQPDMSVIAIDRSEECRKRARAAQEPMAFKSKV